MLLLKEIGEDAGSMFEIPAVEVLRASWLLHTLFHAKL